MPFHELRKGRHSLNNQEYFITFNTQNREKLFSDFDIASIAVRNILSIEGATWLAWVLMPDHFHGILRLDEQALSKIILKCKSKSAVNINKQLKRSGKVWQSNFYDRALRSNESRIDIARYIVANPLRAGLVDKITDYPYWDCVWV